jgi:hypothetical protein
MPCKHLLLAFGLALGVLTSVQATEPPKPNIVFMLVDNLGYGELGCYGGGILRGAPTPRLDRLATKGTRLLNFNVEAQCTPSRSALMSPIAFPPQPRLTFDVSIADVWASPPP